MALSVIGSGFGRTGTYSLKHALETLGFGPCHHMEEVFENPDQVPYWQAVAAGRPVDWNQVFAGYRAQVDWPGAHVWRELAAAFPEAKIVHSVRPEESWWKSYSQTIGKFCETYKELELPPHIRDMSEAACEIIVDKTLGGNALDKDAALAAYRKRTEDVRAAIPADRLLVFDVAEGWAPLCRFLDVSVPAEPFPRLNNTEQFWELVKGGPQ
ncbi:MAG: sulfotransferase family protein [Dongiaceae bacterium]